MLTASHCETEIKAISTIRDKLISMKMEEINQLSQTFNLVLFKNSKHVRKINDKTATKKNTGFNTL